jgi:hypothetical protein
MRRVVGAVVVMAVALGTMTASPAESRPDWREDEIRYARSDGRRGWSTADVRRTIAAAVARWPVPGGLAQALEVAQCESGSDLLAPAGVDGYAGTYQQSERYWQGRRAAFNPKHWDKPLPESPANPRANVVVSIRMAHATGWAVHWAACD